MSGFIKQSDFKAVTKEDYLPVIDKNNPPLCRCGCGEPVTRANGGSHMKWNVYISNHHHNINKRLCACGCGQRIEKNHLTYNKGHKPKSEYPLCLCGCGERVLNNQVQYLPGHYDMLQYNNGKSKNIKYRKEKPLCLCGCNKQTLSPNSKYLPGHYNDILKKEKERIIQEKIINPPLCACGCGEKVTWRGSQNGSFNKYLPGHNHRTKERREQLRIMCANRHCPNIGKLEYEIFPKLIEVCSYKIYCLDSQKIAKSGYHLDGYIEELNLVIEIDEDFHNHTLSLVKDSIREANIKEELNCNFFRIKQKIWKEDSASIIKEFIDTINTLRVSKNL